MNVAGIAVVGLGRIGATHIDGILRNADKCRLAAVVDVREDVAKREGERYGVPYHLSVDAALQDDSIDALVICLPHDLHAPIAIRAANAGRHVLTEKVMALSLDEANQMVAAARDNATNLMVGQSRRFITQLREAKRRLPEIGRISSILYNFACRFDYETAPLWWRQEAKTGGLAYPMLGSHSIDFCLWINPGRKPVSVFACGANNGRGFEGHDTATVVIEFDDGAHATNFLNINTRPTRHEALVTGLDGSIYFVHGGDHEGLIGVPTTDLFINGERVMSGESETHAFAVQMGEFASSILEKRQPEASGEEILTQMRIIEAAMQSAQERRVVPL